MSQYYIIAELKFTKYGNINVDNIGGKKVGDIVILKDVTPCVE